MYWVILKTNLRKCLSHGGLQSIVTKTNFRSPWGWIESDIGEKEQFDNNSGFVAWPYDKNKNI